MTLREWIGPALAIALVSCSGARSPALPPTPGGSREAHLANEPKSRDEPHATPVLITNGPRDRKVVALTFDADMTPSMRAQLRTGEVASWYNRAVVRELRATDTPATFFLTGMWARTYPDAVRSFARDPLFELANHSWDHAAFESGCFGLAAATSPADERGEVRRAAAAIESLAGEPPFYFRFPGGCHDRADLKLVAGLGEQPVAWDVVSGDAFQSDPRAIVRSVLDHVRSGSIVVMHLHGGPNAPATAPALRRLIPALRDRGYRFATLSDLLSR